MTMTEKVIKKAGGITELAKKLNLTRPAVAHWLTRGYEVPPIKHAFLIEKITGIPKEKIWPDVFGEQPAKAEEEK